jgi:copper chaperone CopZ
LSKLQYEKSLLESEKSSYQNEITDIERELEKVKGDSDATISLLQREVMSLTSKVSRLESEIRSKEVSIASLQNQLAECEYCNRCFSVSISPASLTASTGADHTLNYTLYLRSNSCGGCGRTLNIPIILTYDFNTSGTNIDTFGLQATSGNWCCN